MLLTVQISLRSGRHPGAFGLQIYLQDRYLKTIVN
jgi:hypothetical protein